MKNSIQSSILCGVLFVVPALASGCVVEEVEEEVVGDASDPNANGASTSAGSGTGSKPGTSSGSSKPACSLSCKSGGFSYTCGSNSYTKKLSYCSNGKVSSVSFSYSNGHSVSCAMSCSGTTMSCHDDTGKSCVH
jgi:hypothetical protein